MARIKENPIREIREIRGQKKSLHKKVTINVRHHPGYSF